LKIGVATRIIYGFVMSWWCKCYSSWEGLHLSRGIRPLITLMGYDACCAFECYSMTWYAMWEGKIRCYRCQF